MKKLLWLVLILIVIGVGIWWSGLSKNITQNLSGFDDRTTLTLLGSSSNYVSLPDEMVFANSTTTRENLEDGSGVFRQMIQTGGIRKVVLNFGAVGGTATSTTYIRQMGSNDDSTYYDLATSTTVITSTSTPMSVTPRGTKFDIGTASSTISIPFEVDGYRFTRFVMYSDELSTDPDDGVQAWITATLVRDKD